jgi:predicted glycoside hydrolase/deacetylase ChbG (UPF0249 family)
VRTLSNISAIKIADDFGADQFHDAAMLTLLEDGKIDGVSIFSELLNKENTKKLKNLRDTHSIQTGLHFNLTFGDGLPNVSELLRNTISRSLDVDYVVDSLVSQLNIFQSKFGYLPDFLDGHQHVHSFPLINQVVSKVLTKYKFTGWVRNIGSNEPLSFVQSMQSSYLKKFLVLQSLAFFHRRNLRKNNILHNTNFHGLLPLSNPTKLKNALPVLYDASFPISTVIMCHPGSLLGASSHDHPSKSRDIEFQFLSSRQIDA